jgi:hypothetical protein
VITAFRASSFASVLLLVCAPALHASPQAPAQTPTKSASESSTPQRYVRAKSGGAKIYNLADAKGVELESAKAESLLAVYSENAGFLEVEPADGLLVWVSGKYLATTDEPGVLKVTGNGINMRPAPSSTSENSYPLARSLNKSDKVRAESRQHPEKPLAEDWVHVWAPAGTRAWCKKAEVSDATGSDLATLFTSAQKDAHAAAKLYVEPKAASAALASAPKSEKTTPDANLRAGGGASAAAATPAGAQAQGGAGSASAATELATANQLYEKARTSENPDFAAAKASYQKVIDLAPKSSAADSARAGLEKIGLHEEIARIKADKAAHEVDRQARLARAEKDLREPGQRSAVGPLPDARLAREGRRPLGHPLGREGHERSGLHQRALRPLALPGLPARDHRRAAARCRKRRSGAFRRAADRGARRPWHGEVAISPGGAGSPRRSDASSRWRASATCATAASTTTPAPAAGPSGRTR